MSIETQNEKLKTLVEQHNQTLQQIQELQNSLGDLRLQIAKQQGVIEGLNYAEAQKGDKKKDAKA